MIDAVSEQLMQLEPQRASIEARRNAVSNELSRLCLLRLHGDPQESGQDDLLPRVQTLHAERDALEADLQALTDQWGPRVTESPELGLESAEPGDSPPPRPGSRTGFLRSFLRSEASPGTLYHGS